ncbi:hypothetical protein RZE82_00930 [Mollicutes bacterium LVI A0039]|nr:hypothetical protein RZE82_00930 [Mollicutes bacterium LVI A0039]
MEKIVVSRKIVEDAYQNVFMHLERMNYAKAGQLIDFVERNNYPVERDMVDYAKVIIFSNTNRVDEAVRLSELMLSRGLQTPELQAVVSEVHGQLLKQKEFSDRRKSKVNKIKIKDVKHFLDIVKPTDSKLAEFISIFSTDAEMENQLIEYYQLGTISEEDGPLVNNAKIVCAKYQFIEETYQTAKYADKEASMPLYMILSKTILSTHQTSEFILFLFMHKIGLIKEMLVDENFDARVRSFLAYQLDELYSLNLIGRVKIKMVFGGQVYEESIAELNKTFNRALATHGDCLERLFDSGELHEDYIPLLMGHFHQMVSHTYPVINPLNIPLDKFICGFLYVISNNTYNSQFNAIIEDVYKLNQEALKTEMQMIEVLILI